MKFVILGLSITSSWGNGHATTYRALIKALKDLGHEVLFLERDVPYYASNRDMPKPDFCRLGLYKDLGALKEKYASEVEGADMVIVASYVPEGVEVGEWAISTAHGHVAFYDIDTPVTLAKLEDKDYEYLNPELIAKYALYLSFSGGPVLEHLEQFYGSPMARPLYCSVDPDLYYPEKQKIKWQMGYLGTYSLDRQPTVDELLNKPAAHFPKESFVVAGPQYPETFGWAKNVERIEHLPPAEHRAFYNKQKFTLNVTRQAMIKAGHSPSVRLFEAAACGVPIISDYWEGIEAVLKPDDEILIARSTKDVVRYFNEITDQERQRIANNALTKVLKAHTSTARAKELVGYVNEVREPSKSMGINIMEP